MLLVIFSSFYRLINVQKGKGSCSKNIKIQEFSFVQKQLQTRGKLMSSSHHNSPTLSRNQVMAISILNILLNSLTTFIIVKYLAVERYRVASSFGEISIHLIDSIVFLGLGYATQYRYAEIVIFLIRKYAILVVGVSGNEGIGICMYATMAVYLSHLGVCLTTSKRNQKNLIGHMLTVFGVLIGSLYSWKLSIQICITIISLFFAESKLKSLKPYVSILCFSLALPFVPTQICILTLSMCAFSIFQTIFLGKVLTVIKNIHLNLYFFGLAAVIFICMSDNEVYHNISAFWFVQTVLYLVVLGISQIKARSAREKSQSFTGFLGSQLYQDITQEYLQAQGKTQTQIKAAINQQIENRRYNQWLSKMLSLLPFGIFYTSLLVNTIEFNFFTSLVAYALLLYHSLISVSQVHGISYHVLAGFAVSTLAYHHDTLISPHLEFPESVTTYLVSHTCHPWNYVIFFAQVAFAIGCGVVVLGQGLNKWMRVMRLAIKVSFPFLVGLQIWNLGCLSFDKLVPFLCLVLALINTMKQKPIGYENESSDEQINQDSD